MVRSITVESWWSKTARPMAVRKQNTEQCQTERGKDDTVTQAHPSVTHSDVPQTVPANRLDNFQAKLSQLPEA